MTNFLKIVSRHLILEVSLTMKQLYWNLKNFKHKHYYLKDIPEMTKSIAYKYHCESICTSLSLEIIYNLKQQAVQFTF